MKSLFFVLFACFLWATDALFRYPLLKESKVQAGSLVFFEHLFLVLLFLPSLFNNRQKLWNTPISHYFFFFMIGGVGSCLATLAFTQAFTLINPSMVILLQKLQPLIVILLARFYLKEPVREKFIFWAFICLLGAIFVGFGDHISYLWKFGIDFKMRPDALWGVALSLFAVGGWAIATVYGKRLTLLGYTEKQIMAGRFVSGLVIAFCYVVLQKQQFELAPIHYGKIALLAFISGVLGLYFYYKGLKKLSARVCTLAELSFPLMAVVVNWIFLRQELDILQVAGAVMLVLGAGVVQFKHY